MYAIDAIDAIDAILFAQVPLLERQPTSWTESAWTPGTHRTTTGSPSSIQSLELSRGTLVSITLLL